MAIETVLNKTKKSKSKYFPQIKSGPNHKLKNVRQILPDIFLINLFAHAVCFFAEFKFHAG
jgi:hypothetical protein